MIHTSKVEDFFQSVSQANMANAVNVYVPSLPEIFIKKWIQGTIITLQNFCCYSMQFYFVTLYILVQEDPKSLELYRIWDFPHVLLRSCQFMNILVCCCCLCIRM
jgi:hypothetical protein